jgi:hypothetical protein
VLVTSRAISLVKHLARLDPEDAGQTLFYIPYRSMYREAHRRNLELYILKFNNRFPQLFSLLHEFQKISVFIHRFWNYRLKKNSVKT